LNNFTIRMAAVDEQKALEALQWRASLRHPEYREALLANPDAIELPASQIEAGGVFVCEHGGVIVGFAAVLSRDDGGTELDGLFVEPELWRLGIGRRLVEHCAGVSRARGSAALHVIGNPLAEHFYLACGFEHTGTTQTRFGPAPLMRRAL
jgi:GNAT superfamily N-acetyltransferase